MLFPGEVLRARATAEFTPRVTAARGVRPALHAATSHSQPATRHHQASVEEEGAVVTPSDCLVGTEE